MQTLKVENVNDLDLSFLSNDFFIEILSLIIQNKKGQCNPGMCLSWTSKWDPGVCLSWYKWLVFRVQSLNENSLLSKVKCIVSQPLTIVWKF